MMVTTSAKNYENLILVVQQQQQVNGDSQGRGGEEESKMDYDFYNVFGGLQTLHLCRLFTRPSQQQQRQ